MWRKVLTETGGYVLKPWSTSFILFLPNFHECIDNSYFFDPPLIQYLHVRLVPDFEVSRYMDIWKGLCVSKMKEIVPPHFDAKNNLRRREVLRH